MELRHLRYFVGVGEEQHFGRAAERLHIAQPALSRQIQDLEKEIGFPLFERLPRGVKLSAAGKLFLEDARRILGKFRRPPGAPSAWQAARPEPFGWDLWRAFLGMASFRSLFAGSDRNSRTLN